MKSTLFIAELDGITYATLDEAEDAYHAGDDSCSGPVWSNYGGWVN